MKRRIGIARVWCLLLCLFLVLGCAACAADETVAYLDQRLTVAQGTVIYSAAFMSDASDRMTELYCRLLPLMGGPAVGDEERSALRERIMTDLLPTALGAQVSEAEWEKLLIYAATYETELSAAKTDIARFYAYCHFYRKTVAVLGHARAGQLLYDGTVFYLDHRAMQCEDRYQKYGYEWYLEDAKRYRYKLENLSSELDVTSFGDATRVFVYVLSFFTGAAPAELSGEDMPLYDGEVLLILRMQADEFVNIAVTAKQWQLMIELYDDLTPKNLNTPLEAEFSAMQEGGILSCLGGAMPELLTLYRALMYHMTETDIALLRAEGTERDKSGVICRALSSCRGELSCFLDRFEELAVQNDGEAERRAMQRAGALEQCNAFLADTAIVDRQGLLQAMLERAQLRDGEGALRVAVIGYLRGTLPYAAFALAGKG